MKIANLKTNSLNQNNYNNNILTPEFVGSLLIYPVGITPEKCLSCDGYTLKITDYDTLYSVIGTQFNTGEEAEDEFSIPDYNVTGRFLQPGSDVGSQIAAGLPNLSGSVVTSGANLSSASGVFSAGTTATNRDDNLDTSGYKKLSFNASNSNSIYGNSSTVQPPSQIVHVCIRYK